MRRIRSYRLLFTWSGEATSFALIVRKRNADSARSYGRSARTRMARSAGVPITFDGVEALGLLDEIDHQAAVEASAR